jgi:uncharacterized protein (TIGR03435 family)
MRLAIGLSAALCLYAQAPAFEAASIKPSAPETQGSGINISAARIHIINSSLKFCVEMAYDVKEFQVTGGPGWTGSERYDIDAVAGAPFHDGSFRAMLQTLLAERFGLATHRETQERSGYALVVTRGGAKLQPPGEDPSILFGRTPSGDATLKGATLTMAQLATALARRLGSTVLDQTGIEGRYNVSLQWTPDPTVEQMMTKGGAPAPSTDAVSGPSIFAALEETLGLKLEARKVPVEIIVIDRANRPTGN